MRFRDHGAHHLGLHRGQRLLGVGLVHHGDLHVIHAPASDPLDGARRIALCVAGQRHTRSREQRRQPVERITAGRRHDRARREDRRARGRMARDVRANRSHDRRRRAHVGHGRDAGSQALVEIPDRLHRRGRLVGLEGAAAHGVCVGVDQARHEHAATDVDPRASRGAARQVASGLARAHSFETLDPGHTEDEHVRAIEKTLSIEHAVRENRGLHDVTTRSGRARSYTPLVGRAAIPPDDVASTKAAAKPTRSRAARLRRHPRPPALDSARKPAGSAGTPRRPPRTRARPR